MLRKPALDDNYLFQALGTRIIPAWCETDNWCPENSKTNKQNLVLYPKDMKLSKEGELISKYFLIFYMDTFHSCLNVSSRISQGKSKTEHQKLPGILRFAVHFYTARPSFCYNL